MRTVKVIFLFITLIALLTGPAFGQSIPLDQKNWYSMSQVGVIPPVWSGIALSNWVRNTGLQIKPAGVTQNQMCMAGADANCSAFVAAGPGAIWNVRILDGNGATLSDVNLMNGAVVPITEYGLKTVAGNYFWDTGLGTPQFVRWGGTTIADDIASTYMPYVGAFSMGYDTVGGNWDRNSRHAAGDALSATQMGIDSTSFTHFYEGGGSTFRRWYGDDLNNATYTTPANLYAPFDQSFMYGWDTTNNDRWHRISVDSTGAVVTAGSGSMAIKDGDSAVLADVIDNYTDNLAVGLNGLMSASVMYLYDGATLDMGRAGAVGELQVTDVATRPGEDAANDLVKTKKVDTGTLAPAKTTTAAIGAVAAVVLASTEVLSWPNYCIYIQNDDAADSFTDVDYQVSADGAAWVDLTEPAACDTLAPTVTCVFCEGPHAYRYVRVQVTGAAGPTISSVDCWITGNKG